MMSSILRSSVVSCKCLHDVMLFRGEITPSQITPPNKVPYRSAATRAFGFGGFGWAVSAKRVSAFHRHGDLPLDLARLRVQKHHVRLKQHIKNSVHFLISISEVLNEKEIVNKKTGGSLGGSKNPNDRRCRLTG